MSGSSHRNRLPGIIPTGLRRLRNPDLFHGQGRTRDFFEGWYFKVVNREATQAFAFIPGLFLGRDPGENHSFVQLVHGTEARHRYLAYPAADFRAERDTCQIAVGDNAFSLEGLSLNSAAPQLTVQGRLTFHNVRKWPDTVLNPGSMGFYNYLPRMQCYSQVCALDMDIEGSLSVNGREIDFGGGWGYIEKNWGRAFPLAWIWIQSNHFPGARASLSCSLGHIPFLGSSFKGFLIGLTVGEAFYSFTTTNRSTARVHAQGTDVRIRVDNARYRLDLATATHREDFILLHGPREGRMVPLVQENLLGRVRVELSARRSGQVLFAGEGRCAGIEYGGEQMGLLDAGERVPEGKIQRED